MAKNKQIELEREIEKLKRIKKRKLARLAKYTKSVKRRKSFTCTCGEDPYCYCGDGTPYSY